MKRVTVLVALVGDLVLASGGGALVSTVLPFSAWQCVQAALGLYFLLLASRRA